MYVPDRRSSPVGALGIEGHVGHAVFVTDDWSADRMANGFWDTSHEYGVHPPLTDTAVANCERALGERRPADYIALLKVQNGGVVAQNYAAFRTDHPTSWAPDHVPFDQYSGIGPEFPSITESPYLNAEWG